MPKCLIIKRSDSAPVAIDQVIDIERERRRASGRLMAKRKRESDEAAGDRPFNAEEELLRIPLWQSKFATDEAFQAEKTRLEHYNRRMAMFYANEKRMKQERELLKKGIRLMPATSIYDIPVDSKRRKKMPVKEASPAPKKRACLAPICPDIPEGDRKTAFFAALGLDFISAPKASSPLPDCNCETAEASSLSTIEPAKTARLNRGRHPLRELWLKAEDESNKKTKRDNGKSNGKLAAIKQKDIDKGKSKKTASKVRSNAKEKASEARDDTKDTASSKVHDNAKGTFAVKKGKVDKPTSKRSNNTKKVSAKKTKNSKDKAEVDQPQTPTDEKPTLAGPEDKDKDPMAAVDENANTSRTGRRRKLTCLRFIDFIF